MRAVTGAEERGQIQRKKRVLRSFCRRPYGHEEKRLATLTFRLAVETDLVAGILADTCQLSREELRRRRAESVRNVKATNGRVSLEGRAREVWEEGDEWLD